MQIIIKQTFYLIVFLLNKITLIIITYYVFLNNSGIVKLTPINPMIQAGGIIETTLDCTFIFSLFGLTVSSILLAYKVHKIWAFEFILIFFIAISWQTDFVQKNIYGHYPSSTWKRIKNSKNIIEKFDSDIKHLVNFAEKNIGVDTVNKYSIKYFSSIPDSIYISYYSTPKTNDTLFFDDPKFKKKTQLTSIYIRTIPNPQKEINECYVYFSPNDFNYDSENNYKGIRLSYFHKGYINDEFRFNNLTNFDENIFICKSEKFKTFMINDHWAMTEHCFRK